MEEHGPPANHLIWPIYHTHEHFNKRSLSLFCLKTQPSPPQSFKRSCLLFVFFPSFSLFFPSSLFKTLCLTLSHLLYLITLLIHRLLLDGMTHPHSNTALRLQNPTDYHLAHHRPGEYPDVFEDSPFLHDYEDVPGGSNTGASAAGFAHHHHPTANSKFPAHEAIMQGAGFEESPSDYSLGGDLFDTNEFTPPRSTSNTVLRQQHQWMSAPPPSDMYGGHMNPGALHLQQPRSLEDDYTMQMKYACMKPLIFSHPYTHVTIFFFTLTFCSLQVMMEKRRRRRESHNAGMAF